MDIWTVLKACTRRWYVFLPILGAALLIGNVQAGDQPPIYSATSSAVLAGPALVPGADPDQIVEVNPFESLGGSLNTTTQIVVSLMDSGPKRDELYDQGLELDYSVDRDEAVVYFYVEGDDPTEVIDTATTLVDAMDVAVAELQSRPVEAPASRIRAVPLALPTLAHRDSGAGIQLLTIIGIVGLVIATGAAIATDGLAGLRARRLEQRRAAAADAGPGAPATGHAPHEPPTADDLFGRYGAEADDTATATETGTDDVYDAAYDADDDPTSSECSSARTGRHGLLD